MKQSFKARSPRATLRLFSSIMFPKSSTDFPVKVESAAKHGRVKTFSMYPLNIN